MSLDAAFALAILCSTLAAIAVACRCRRAIRILRHQLAEEQMARDWDEYHPGETPPPVHIYESLQP